MTLTELIADVRVQLDDLTEPYLWSDAELRDLLDEAEDDLCERALCLPDQEELAYDVADAWLALPPYILQIRGAYDAAGRPVAVRNRTPWDSDAPETDYAHPVLTRDWLQETDSRVRALVLDLRVDQLRLYPLPTAAGTLTLDVFRRPRTPLRQRNSMELTDRKALRLVQIRACSQAYRKQDGETFNPGIAQSLDQEYLAGAQELLHSLRKRRHANQPIQYGGL